jgi:hypothetical protein
MTAVFRRYLGVACCACWGSVLPVAAQNPPAAGISPGAADTPAVKSLLGHVVARLAPRITQAALDTATQPWSIRMPSTAAPWATFEAHLRTALRARPVTPTDSQYYQLEIRELPNTTDTVRIQLLTGLARRCRGELGGHVNTEVVYVFRVVMAGASHWSNARSDTLRHGDRFGC